MGDLQAINLILLHSNPGLSAKLRHKNPAIMPGRGYGRVQVGQKTTIASGQKPPSRTWGTSRVISPTRVLTVLGFKPLELQIFADKVIH
jgi:hypothetical protein